MYITTWPIWNTYAHNTGKIYDSFAIMQDRCACCHIPLVWVEEGPLVQEVDECPLVQEGPSPSAVTSVIKNTIDTVNVHVLCCKCIVGASLSKPHIDRDNSPRSRNNAIYLSIYLSMYHVPRVCRTPVHKICVRPEMLRVFRYIDVLTCVIYNCTWQNTTWVTHVPTLPWRLSTKTGRWMRRYMVQTAHSAYWDSGAVTARQLLQRACVITWWADSLYCCFVTFTLTKARHWIYYSACILSVDVELYRLTMLRHHWHCSICTCTCSYWSQ